METPSAELTSSYPVSVVFFFSPQPQQPEAPQGHTSQGTNPTPPENTATGGSEACVAQQMELGRVFRGHGSGKAALAHLRQLHTRSHGPEGAAWAPVGSVCPVCRASSDSAVAQLSSGRLSAYGRCSVPEGGGVSSVERHQGHTNLWELVIFQGLDAQKPFGNAKTRSAPIPFRDLEAGQDHPLPWRCCWWTRNRTESCSPRPWEGNCAVEQGQHLPITSRRSASEKKCLITPHFLVSPTRLKLGVTIRCNYLEN